MLEPWSPKRPHDPTHEPPRPPERTFSNSLSPNQPSSSSVSAHFSSSNLTQKEKNTILVGFSQSGIKTQPDFTFHAAFPPCPSIFSNLIVKADQPPVLLTLEAAHVLEHMDFASTTYAVKVIKR